MRRHLVHTSISLAVAAVASQAIGQVNGRIDPGEFQFTLAQQTADTGFGVNYSQMDAAYASILPDGSLHLMITGNQENNGNGLCIMIDNGRGGAVATIGNGGKGIFGDIPGRYTQALGTNPNSNVNDLKPGSSFAPGFNPSYGIGVNLYADQYYTDVYWLAKHAGDPNSDDYVGNNAFTSATATAGSTVATYALNGINGTFEHAYDNTNTAGGVAAPLSSQTGYEAIFSAAFLNVKPGSTVKLLAFIAGGNSRYLSNQFLPGLPQGTPNLGGYDGGSPGPEFDFDVYPSVTYLPIERPTSTSATASHVWSSASSWSTSSVPTGVNAQAVINGSKTVTLDTNITLGTLELGSTGSITISGPSTLTLQAFAGDNALLKGSGNSTISTAVVLGSNLDAAISGGTTTVTTAVSAPAYVVNKSGAGTLALKSLDASSLSVSGGTVSLPAVQHTVSTLSNLVIANDGAALGTRVYSASVDVGTSDLIVRGLDEADSAAKFGSVNDMARAAQTGNPNALFGANGLTSSVAAADANGQLRYAVGVVQNNLGGDPLFTTFDGVTVGLNDVLVKFTYFGDADLNGFVDDTDFFLVNNGYGNGLTGWVNGDFDYSGAVDDTDFFLINNAYGLQGAPLRAGGAVPEPTGMGLIALGAGAVLGRRRR